ncbi:MAG: AbrB/MazE/SpoVT family DNA-binding domain-containing protein [Candidatus Hydrothermarchaeaceae archaeon]
MGIKMGKIKVDERGRVTLPGALREEMGLYPGKEVNVERAGKGVLLKPVVSKKVFLQSLEGCITEKNQAEKLDPSKLKEIWGVFHAHD